MLSLLFCFGILTPNKVWNIAELWRPTSWKISETELILTGQHEEILRTLNLCVFSFSRSDCVEILKKCGDQNKFPEDHTAESICELLSPTDDLENCIPLDTYLSKCFFFFNFKRFFLSLPSLLWMNICLLRTCGLMIVSQLQALILFSWTFWPRKELSS